MSNGSCCKGTAISLPLDYELTTTGNIPAFYGPDPSPGMGLRVTSASVVSSAPWPWHTIAWWLFRLAVWLGQLTIVGEIEE
jgi:hypothetical protein